MKNVHGAVAHKRGILKSIVLVMFVFITTVTVGCSENSQKSVADIGGARGQEIRKESVQGSITTDIGGKSISTLQYYGVTTPAEIGGSKTIKGEFLTTSDIGGKSSGTIQFSEVAISTDIGGRNSTVGIIALADIGGRNGILTGNVTDALFTDIGGGRDVVIIKLTSDTMAIDIGGGGKGSSTTLLV